MKSTVGIANLGAETGSWCNSVIRMFGYTGNPQTHNSVSDMSHLQPEQANVAIEGLTTSK